MNNSILLVEDESELRDFLTSVFEENGYRTISVNAGKKAFEVLESFKPNLMILDHNLPDIKGSQILSQLKADAKFADVPVVFLTAVSNEDNIVNAFDMGADDYIEKPFSVNILLKRIKAILNRYQEKDTYRSSRNILRKGDLEIDLDSYKVKIGETNLEITLMEFNILKELVKADGKPLSRESLINRINGSTSVTERTIDVHICAIRKKLNTCGKTIETIRGVGYRLHL